MKIKTIIIGLMFMPLNMLAQTNIGYTNETVSRNNIFRYSRDTDQRLAMRLSSDKLQYLEGKSIKAIRMAFGSKNSTSSKATVFLGTTLDSPICEETVTITSTNKFVEIPLSQPYTITGKETELYIGCMMEIASNYGPFSSDFSKDMKNVYFAYADGKWDDLYGNGFGCPNIEAVISETLDFNDVCIKSFEEDGYVKQGENLSRVFQLQNCGTKTITSFDAIVKIGESNSKIVSFTDLSIAPHKTYDFTIDNICAEKTGRQDISVTLVNVNSIADVATSDNTASTSAYFYPMDMQKNVLVETFTSQSCTNCPLGHSSMATAMSQLPQVNTVSISHHSGYKTDIFSMKEDWTLTSLYNGSTYAPAAMFNRTVMGEDISPISESSSISENKTRLQNANVARPYVSIALDSKYDTSNRNVTLNCKFFTHEQMPGEELHYSIWLVQDDIVAAQGGATADYVHHAVSRGCLTESAWGEVATFNVGETLEVTKTFRLPEIIASTSYTKTDLANEIATVLDNMKLVVFVHQQSGNDLAGCKVFNCAEVKLNNGKYTQGGFPSEKTRILKSQTYFGDAQGEEGENVATRKLEFFYNDNDQIIRKIETSKNTGEDIWNLTHYYKYTYDANSNLTLTNSLQYGTFDYDEMGFFAPNDTVTYEYNDKGQLIKESYPLKYFTYEYDEKGNNVKRYTWNINSITREATNDLIEKYSDFISINKPLSVTATSPTGKEWNEYSGIYSYDSDNNLISKKYYTSEGTLKYAEYWSYLDGQLKEHLLPTVFDDGIEVENEKEVYTFVDGNNDKVMHEAYIANGDGTWSKMAGTRCIDEYGYLSANDGPELTITPDDYALNSVSISAVNAIGQEASFYRNGILIENMSGLQKLNTSDLEVKNGTYEYFVTVDGRASNIVTCTFDTPLPSVKGVKIESTRKDILGNNYATISWDELSLDSRLGFLSYSLFYENMKSSEVSTEDSKATSLEINLGTERSKTLYIQTSYKLGRANSESITIDLDNLPSSISGIHSSTSNPQWYNLSGQRVDGKYKGIIVSEGKKLKVK